jgi:poly-gamma-glutamate capsule biosynthesis protein CapA/YwtB (metallophosphatase superfamily)
MPATVHNEVRLMFGGDVMLGRTVREYIEKLGPGYPLAPLAPLLRQADLVAVNLECAITAGTHRWAGEPKAFYFGAPPEAAETLRDAGIGLASLANNHTLDFGVEGLADTLRALGAVGVQYTGAGASLTHAARPAIVARKGMTFGMAAFCDHQEDFAAGERRPGIAWLDLDDEAAALAAFAAALAPLRAAGVDWPILSLHWGPNMVRRPRAAFQRLAHGAIDMGWKTLFGHSAHVFHGIEIRNGYPIIYAAGDLVDDYYVDREFRNDLQLLFELDLGRDGLHRIVMHPVAIEACRVAPADAAETRFIFDEMRLLCGELGTRVHEDATRLVINPAEQSPTPSPYPAPSSG